MIMISTAPAMYVVFRFDVADILRYFPPKFSVEQTGVGLLYKSSHTLRVEEMFLDMKIVRSSPS
jgi:hypothetical protein